MSPGSAKRNRGHRRSIARQTLPASMSRYTQTGKIFQEEASGLVSRHARHPVPVHWPCLEQHGSEEFKERLGNVNQRVGRGPSLSSFR